ncbi:dioxygenase [Streptomyces asoensis]|uniref:dioxygenase family protein n=1 Tax=Streptomyces asoensis TaxID=249586 RepID=UPI0033D57355
MDFTVDTATRTVVESFRDTGDPRLREVLESLTHHLHAFVRDVRPTPDEWAAAVDFLTAVGHRCDDTRQEFVLLSDVLGVSMLVETLDGVGEGTESTVLGPFHQSGSPRRDLGDSIDLLGTGRPCVVSGRVLATDGTPLPGAELDVWQCDEQGFYDVQQPGVQPPGNGRGLFRADGEGRFWFRTVVPSPYPIPTDGPVGALLRATGRHPYRPAHIHFIVSAGGHRPVTTHAFVAGSPYLDSDAVFAVKQDLIADFAPSDDERAAEHFGVPVPFTHAALDLVLAPQAGPPAEHRS